MKDDPSNGGGTSSPRGAPADFHASAEQHRRADAVRRQELVGLAVRL